MWPPFPEIIWSVGGSWPAELNRERAGQSLEPRIAGGCCLEDRRNGIHILAVYHVAKKPGARRGVGAVAVEAGTVRPEGPLRDLSSAAEAGFRSAAGSRSTRRSVNTNNAIMITQPRDTFGRDEDKSENLASI